MYVFLFPGQGSQTPRMGYELYQSNPRAKRLFELADEILARPLTNLIFEGRAEELQRTENLQPAVTLVNAACLEALRDRGVEPAAAAGHSLGEYSACYAAGVFDFETLIRLTAARGRLMGEAAAARPGAMLAVTGLAAERVDAIVAEASASGVLCVANRNTEDQTVLSGESAAIEKAAALATAAGARAATRLRVSGAWHSPLMSASRAVFERELDAAAFRDARIDVYANVTAEPVRSAPRLRELLARQYDSPVLWLDSMRNLIRDRGAARFVEAGPGRVLTGLMLAIDRKRQVSSVNSPATLDSFLRRAVGAHDDRNVRAAE